MSYSDPHVFAHIRAYGPEYVHASDAPASQRMNAALAAYTGGGYITASDLADIIEAGVRAMSTAKADITVTALRDARDEIGRTLAASRDEMARTREGFRAELEQIRAQFTQATAESHQHTSAAMQSALSAVAQQTAHISEALPQSARDQLAPMVLQFRESLTAAATEIMDPANGRAGASLATSVEKLLDGHSERIGRHFSELNERLGVAEARAEVRDKSSAKGADFEEELEPLLSACAEAQQLVLTDTGTEQGALKASKKGDFLLSDGDVPLVAIEAKNRSNGLPDAQINREINEMLENRRCSVGVWIVKGRAQNKGHLMRQINDTRWIVAADDGLEDILPAVLRLAVAVARRGRDTSDADVTVARAKVQEAITASADLDQLQTMATEVSSSAGKLERKISEIRRRVASSLNAASEALADG